MVSVEAMANHLHLVNLTPEIDISQVHITTMEVNRPALQLAGYYEHFDNERVQIIGHVEYTYLSQMEETKRRQSFERLVTSRIPCVVFTTLPEGPDSMFVEVAHRHGIPMLVTERETSSFMAELIRWLGVELAPSVTVHGVLVDIFGEGVLIMGESGIGKSEAALELVHRGHRLVSDDVVVIHKVSDVTLVGSAPDLTRHLIELRGIGIIDVKTLYGVQHVKATSSIDLVIRLEDWDRDKEYDRMGLEDEYTEFLGNKVVCHTLPIRPGRNLAIIAETAAVNHRQKKMGYNAAQELYRRFQENLTADEPEGSGL